VIAYRYFTDRPLDKDEQAAAVRLWDSRLANPTGINSNNPGDNDLGGVDTQKWLDIRNTVPGVTQLHNYDVQVFSDVQGTYGVLNCSRSAIETAANTLKARIAKYGIGSKQVKTWVQNQDLVFKNCGMSGNQGPSLPKDPGASADSLCRADYKYQLAAANFYAGKLDLAQQQFAEIAADQNSPWHKIASYLQARTATRKIMFAELKNGMTVSADDPQLAEADALVKKLLADNSMLEYKADLQELSDYLNYRLNALANLRHLAASVLNQHSGSTLERSLGDYTLMLNDLGGSTAPTANADSTSQTQGDSSPSKNKEKAKQLRDECCKEDLTDWLLTFQTPADQDPPQALQRDVPHIIDKWKATKSTPWLIAALSAVEADDATTAALIKAAQELPVTSPAYLSAQYYSLKLMAKQGSKAEARNKVDELLTAKSLTIPPSSRNLLLALRQKLATSLDECLTYGLKAPVAPVSDPSYTTLPDDFDKTEKLSEYERVLPTTLDDRMATEINDQFPLSIWEQLCNNKNLSPKLHKQIVATTWMRAVLLGNDSLALKLAPTLQVCYPSVKEFLSSYISAKTASAKRFAACYTMLKAPGLSPYLRGGLGRTVNNILERDDYGDNYWLPSNPDAKPDQPAYPVYEAGDNDPALVSPDVKRFLTAEQKEAALKERRTMFTTSSPPKFITEAVLAWSKEQPQDPHVPEALARAIKMPRWGCRVPHSSEYSKAAFTRLHSQYPSTSWAKNAQYYY
jgi:hypothetical protein